MTYTVTLEDRFTAAALPSSGLTYEPVSYSHAAIGGPKRAEIAVKGNEIALWQGLNSIGNGIRVYSQYGDAVWWGYIHEARLDVGVFTVRVNMDQVANKVRVIYSYVEPGTSNVGERRMTAFLYDLESINKYGLKELTFSTSGATTTTAEALRTTLLAEMKVPIPEITLIGSQSRETKLTYYCRGWWETLDWRYYASKYDEYGYKDNGTGALEFGYTGTPPDMVAQSFQLPAAGMTIRSARVGLSKTGSPTDNLTAAIYSNNAGAPGTALATSNTVSGTLIKTDFEQITFTFPTAYSAAGTTTYWLVVDRSGADEAANYYKADLDFTAAYTGGSFLYHNGSTWTAASIPTSDMGFIVSSEQVGAAVETTTQIKNIIEYNAANVAVKSAEIVNASGITSSPYRADENTALYEIEELLKLGTTNNRRLLAKVLSNKTVQIYEEPVNTSKGYVNSKGEIFDSYGGRMRKETCPVGLWVDLRSVAPAGASFGIIGAQSTMFIEEAEYNVEREQLRLEPRENIGTFDFLRVRNG